MESLFAIIVFSLFLCSMGQQCPSLYQRYSKEHSYCKSTSPTCPIFHSGVSDIERRQIVDLHNQYRSTVATGREKKAGGLPQAADMMQMVWDKELAAVAQKRAEQCIYAHDCSNCRRVENFPVGQNIAYRDLQCSGATKCPLNGVPDWKSVIKMFYDEVAIFDKTYVKSMVFVPGKEYGHFTAMAWSTTWRIGCGFVAFKQGNGYRQFYVCNYGPGGNVIQTPMYKTGVPCSSCPTNSCCGRSCSRADYEGLCRMNRIEAPIYRPQPNNLLYCDFSTLTGDCSAGVVGTNKWKFIKSLGGSFAEIILAGGETSTLKLKTTMRPKQNFCLVMKYRSGPSVDGQKLANSAVMTLEIQNGGPVTMILPRNSNVQQFFQYSVDLGWSYDTKASFTFSVPNGAPAQFFNIQLLRAFKGKCS